MVIYFCRFILNWISSSKYGTKIFCIVQTYSYYVFFSATLRLLLHTFFYILFVPIIFIYIYMFATTIIIKLSLLTSLLEKCAWNDVFPRNAILFDFCSIFMTYGVQYMQNAMQLWTGHKWVEQRRLFWSTSAPFEDKSLCRCQ